METKDRHGIYSKQKYDSQLEVTKNGSTPKIFPGKHLSQSTFLVTLHRYYWVLLLPFHSYWRHKHSSGYGKLSRISTYTLLTSSWNYSLVFRTDLGNFWAAVSTRPLLKYFRAGATIAETIREVRVERFRKILFFIQEHQSYEIDFGDNFLLFI